MRVSLTLAVALGILSVAVADPTRAAVRTPTNIPAQGLGPALKEFAASRDLQVIYFADTVRDLRTLGALGEITTDEALTRILSGTGLTYRYVDDKTITILPVNAASSKNSHAVSAARDASRGHDVAVASAAGTPEAKGAQESKSFWDRFRLAQVDQGRSENTVNTQDTTSPSAASSEAGKSKVEEIVVTAQKREERLQDVPVPVTAITGQSLLDSNQLRLQDYYTRIPGLSVTPDDLAGGPKPTIRGITTGGFLTPTVGILVDDVPYGATVGTAGGYRAPDLDPSDLVRVEVLRGPQGTLYGASSLGGLIKYVTIAPSTARLSARVQGGVSGVHNGDGMGYNLRASVNVPLGDMWAIQASGFTRRDPGFIDDPVHGIDGVNEREVSGGRVSTLWQPSEEFSLKLGALLQRNKADGSSFVYVQPGLGELEQSSVPGSGQYSEKVEVYTANITAQLGPSELTSLSGYNVGEREFWFNLTPLFAPAVQASGMGIGFPSYKEDRTTRFTQEVRLSTPLGQRFEWLIGAFYTHEKTPSRQAIFRSDFATGARVSTFNDLFFPSKYQETAAFTNLTWKVTERFDIQFGGRESQNRQTFSQTNLLNGAAMVPLIHTEENAFTYLVTPSFKVSSDLMVYARLASGYRPGGPNSVTPTTTFPREYDADTTQNYEIGVKGSVLDGALSFDASVFHIKWKDIQLQLFDAASGGGYRANGSAAKSEGVELFVEAMPFSGLTIAGWISWNQAELTEDLPPGSTAFGLGGARLPHGSRLSGNLSVDEEFPVTSSVRAFFGASVSYVGDRLGVFSAQTAQRQRFPSYTQTDLRAGLKYEPWTLSLVANNVTDERAMIAGGLGSGLPVAFSFIQPRTLGLSVARTF